MVLFSSIEELRIAQAGQPAVIYIIAAGYREFKFEEVNTVNDVFEIYTLTPIPDFF